MIYRFLDNADNFVFLTLPEYFDRLCYGLWHWYRLGGFHRLLLLIATIMGVICLRWVWEKIREWLGKL